MHSNLLIVRYLIDFDRSVRIAHQVEPETDENIVRRFQRAYAKGWADVRGLKKLRIPEHCIFTRDELQTQGW